MNLSSVRGVVAGWRIVGLISGALILAEILIEKQAQYVYGDWTLALIPGAVFGGLTLGNLIGLAPPLTRVSWSALVLLLGTVITCAFLGMPNSSLGAVFWMAVPFAGFGIVMVRVFSEYALIVLVYGLALGGCLLYLLLNPLLTYVGPHLPLVLVFLVLLALLATEPTRPIVAAGVALLVLCATLEAGGFLEPKFMLARNLPIFANSTAVGQTVYNPLIRTDVRRFADGRYAYVVNGSRFGIPLSKPEFENQVKGQHPFGLLPYDAPYAFGPRKKVLIIGCAEGCNVVAALKAHVDTILALDINAALFEVMNENPLLDFTGRLYQAPHVTPVISEGRHFLETTDQTFDVITLQGVQTGSQSSLVDSAAIESYLFTREATQTLWNRLTPDGILMYDEYRNALNPEQRKFTLLESLGETAFRTLQLNNRQYAFLSYLQDVRDPTQERAQSRDLLLLSRKPLGPDRVQIDSKLLAMRAAGFQDLNSTDLSSPSHAPVIRHLHELSEDDITDDHPFLSRRMTFLAAFGRVETGLYMPFVLIVPALFVAVFWKQREQRLDVLALYFTGTAYIQLVIAAVGPMILFLGEPHLATPVVFTTIYLFGLLGGLMALKLGSRHVSAGLFVLVGYAGLLPILLQATKPIFLSCSSLSLRVVMAALVISPLGLLAELPYIFLLNRFEGKQRGQAYTWENIGTLAGVPIGLWLQLSLGYRYAAWCGALIYAITLGVLALRLRRSSEQGAYK